MFIVYVCILSLIKSDTYPLLRLYYFVPGSGRGVSQAYSHAPLKNIENPMKNNKICRHVDCRYDNEIKE